MPAIEYVASACLCGLKCKYNGGSNPSAKIVQLYHEGKILPICPETLAGLPAPRLPSEIIQDGRVISKSNEDLTGSFEKGASLALEQALGSGCRKAILKSRSPSCGYGAVYDGTFSGKLRAGNGKWTEKLLAENFSIWTEENLPF